MTTEINVYYFEHNCILHKNFTFSEFCESFHFNALLNPPGLTVYKILYKFVTHTLSHDT